MKIAVYKNNYRGRFRGPNPTSFALRKKPVGEFEVETEEDNFMSMSAEELERIRNIANQKFGDKIWRLRIVEVKKWE